MLTQSQLDGIKRLRQEWEQAADGESLLMIKTYVGYFLADIVRVLNLDPDEQIRILGSNLYIDLNSNG